MCNTLCPEKDKDQKNKEDNHLWIIHDNGSSNKLGEERVSSSNHQMATSWSMPFGLITKLPIMKRSMRGYLQARPRQICHSMEAIDQISMKAVDQIRIKTRHGKVDGRVGGNKRIDEEIS